MSQTPPPRRSRMQHSPPSMTQSPAASIVTHIPNEPPTRRPRIQNSPPSTSTNPAPTPPPLHHHPPPTAPTSPSSPAQTPIFLPLTLLLLASLSAYLLLRLYKTSTRHRPHPPNTRVADLESDLPLRRYMERSGTSPTSPAFATDAHDGSYGDGYAGATTSSSDRALSLSPMLARYFHPGGVGIARCVFFPFGYPSSLDSNLTPLLPAIPARTPRSTRRRRRRRGSATRGRSGWMGLWMGGWRGWRGWWGRGRRGGGVEGGGVWGE